MTKCAGTSLAISIRDALPLASSYICSSFTNNIAESREDLSERHSADIRFIFGHYVHESLLAIYSDRPLYLTIGLRHPVDRAISEYHHLCRVRRDAGLPVLAAQAFLEERQNTMCREILRAFPSYSTSVNANAKDALRAIELFDVVYDDETLGRAMSFITSVMQIEPVPIPRYNQRFIDATVESYQRSQENEVLAQAELYFAEDLSLHSALQSRLEGCDPSRSQIESARAAHRRLNEALYAEPCASFRRHTAHYFVHDLISLGRASVLRSLIERKRAWAAELETAAAAFQQGGTH